LVMPKTLFLVAVINTGNCHPLVCAFHRRRTFRSLIFCAEKSAWPRFCRSPLPFAVHRHSLRADAWNSASQSPFV
jgi:hypothetical protein